MLVGEEHAIEPIDVGIKQLLAQVGRSVDQYAGVAAISAGPLDQQRATTAAIAGDCRGRRRPSPAPDAAHRMTSRIPGWSPSASRGASLRARHFGEQAKEIVGRLLRDLVPVDAANARQNISSFNNI